MKNLFSQYAGLKKEIYILFFGKLVGIGVGTILCTVINAPMIAAWGNFLDKHFHFDPALKRK